MLRRIRESNFDAFAESAKSVNVRKLPVYPADHQVGMEVPKGGSNCAKCEYLKEDGKTCGEPHFIKWNGGTGRLPEPSDRYCCDFFEVG